MESENDNVDFFYASFSYKNHSSLHFFVLNISGSVSGSASGVGSILFSKTGSESASGSVLYQHGSATLDLMQKLFKNRLDMLLIPAEIIKL